MVAPIDRVQLRTLGSDALKVVSPFDVEIEIADGCGVLADLLVLWVPEIREYGEGESLREATGDLQANIIDFYNDLKAHEEILGRELKRTLATMRSKIREQGAPA